MLNFSSDVLVHYVFANEGDTYYGDDLLALDFHQYLWLQLHKSGYDPVYFLRQNTEKKSLFTVKSFGDKKVNKYQSDNPGLFGRLFAGNTNVADSFGRWLKTQLVDKHKSAIVCPLDEFCDVLSDDSWKNTLNSLAQMKHHSGIIVLVAPVFAEQSMEYLLNSPALCNIQEPAALSLRNSTEYARRVYYTLKDILKQNCEFLNTFTNGIIRSILLRVIMEKPERFREIEQLSRVLAEYLNNSELQQKYPVFKQNLSANLYFKTLYQMLLNQDIWDSVEKLDNLVAHAGGLESFLEQEDFLYNGAKSPLGILRDENKPEGKCLSITVPEGFVEPEIPGDAVADVLSELKTELSDPYNIPADETMQRTLGMLYNHIQSAEHRKDWPTWKRALYSIQLVCRYLYILENDEKKNELAGLLSDYLNLSEKQSEQNRTIPAGSLAAHPSVRILQEKLAQQAESRARINASLLQTMDAQIAGEFLYTPSRVQFSELAHRFATMIEQTAVLPAEEKPTAASKPSLGDIPIFIPVPEH